MCARHRRVDPGERVVSSKRLQRDFLAACDCQRWRGDFMPFTLRDIVSGRRKSDAVAELQKIITADLAPTNWRLMTDGIYNQLGILVGRLRGYERECDLALLIGKSRKRQ